MNFAVPEISASFVRAVCPRRPLDANKSTFGKLLIRGGSRRYPHAPVLAAKGAIRSGTGLVALEVPEASRVCAAHHAPEAVFHLRGDDESGYSAAVFGPGAGLDELEIPAFPKLLLDADGLNRLARTGQTRIAGVEELIITPHPGEAARLLQCRIADIQFDRMGAVKALAEKYNCVAVLKGAGTLICRGEHVWKNPTGNPGMATAGSGDVLAGVIGGLWAQGVSAFDAARAGVWIHGRAGDVAASLLGQAALSALDIAEKICVFS